MELLVETNFNSTGTEMSLVTNRIKSCEELHQTVKIGNKAVKSSATRSKPSACKRFLESRLISLLFGPLFGLFLYYYITFLVLSGPPFTKEIDRNNTSPGIRWRHVIKNEEHLTRNSNIDRNKKEAMLLDDSLRCIAHYTDQWRNKNTYVA